MTKPNITKIVLTGGPCGGKSTAIEKIDEYFTKRGYKVISVPETATELISNGITPQNCENPFEFQKILMTLQMEKEHLFEKAASNMNYKKIIMLYDRGVLDNKGYVNNDEFNKLMRLFNTTIIHRFIFIVNTFINYQLYYINFLFHLIVFLNLLTFVFLFLVRTLLVH